MQKLLFLTPELPYPAHSGGKLKSLNLLKHLAGRFAVTLACPLKLEDGDHVGEFLEQVKLDALLCEPVAVPRSAKNLCYSYLRNQPLNVVRTQSVELRKQIEAIADEFDVVLVDHYEVAQYLPDSFTGVVMYHAHNAYHKMWQRYAEHATNIAYKTVSSLEAVRVRKAELSICRRADLCFAAPNDIRALVDAGADAQKFSVTYHLGDDQQITLPPLRFQSSERSLVYVGFLGWEPNVIGLLWFIEHVWPLLLDKDPQLTFRIVGKHPDERLVRATARYPGIHLTGFVADLENVLPRSRVCVAPLTFGSGMKVKVLSAMARGIPTVTTSIGAESIDATHGQHLMISDEAASMANDIERLLNEPDIWKVLADASRQLVREKYTWRRLFNMMDSHIDRVLAASQSTEEAVAWAV